MKRAISIISLLLLVSCGKSDGSVDGEASYFCDAETMETDEYGSYFKNDTVKFRGGEGQSADFAYEGKYSMKLDSSLKYGMAFDIKDPKLGEYFEARVMTRDEEDLGKILVTFKGDTTYTIHSKCFNPSETKDGWREHFINFTIDTEVDEVKFFCFSNSNLCYFDNLEVKRYDEQPEPENLSPNHLSLSITDSCYDILQKYKKTALVDGIISGDLKQYVDAEIKTETGSFPVEMRLKGDWTDHIESGKPSYRIKTSSKGSFMSLRSFSIQHPQTRNYMHEWFVHRWFDKEDLLSTKYEFITVDVNGTYRGVYAMEEHFDKQLLESRNFREGPILKYDESGFWALLNARTEAGEEKSYPYYEASTVSLFKKGRTSKSPTLMGQFKNAAVLAQRFKDHDPHPEEIFDLKKLAKMYAILEVANVHHATAWHNRRFYYNPVTTRLEHVCFDMQPGLEPKQPLRIIENLKDRSDFRFNEFVLDYYLFRNEEFVNLYLEYVKLYSSEEYLADLFYIYEQDIKDAEDLLSLEYSNYKFDKQFYLDKASKIREDLQEVPRLLAGWQKRKSTEPKPENREYTPNTDNFSTDDLALNIYVDSKDSLNHDVHVENFHLNGIEILGYAIRGAKDSMILYKEKKPMEPFVSLNQMDTLRFHQTEFPNYIYYKALNNPGIIERKKAIRWPKPNWEHPRVELEKKFKKESKFYEVVEGDEFSVLFFKTGRYQIDELLYIPDDYHVNIEAGTEIDFVNGGGIITNNSTTILGRESEPIIFTSSDSSSMGITVLGGTSTMLKYVTADNLGTLDYKGWTLTGAISIYETEAIIEAVEISNNNCEDALNTIRCKIYVTDIKISNTYSDAYDADFCNGTFTNSYFENTGNDAIDFSGSVVEIGGIKMKNVGDKGVSAGERSELTLNEITIDGALTAIASKDQSEVIASDIDIKNIEIGVAVFRKKPEFGPASITLNNVTHEAIKTQGIVELGSELTWDGERYRGYVKFDIEAMYARFEK